MVTLFGADWQHHPANFDGLRRLTDALLDVVMDRAEEQTPRRRRRVADLGL